MLHPTKTPMMMYPVFFSTLNLKEMIIDKKLGKTNITPENNTTY
jgi:hypothetical protein